MPPGAPWRAVRVGAVDNLCAPRRPDVRFADVVNSRWVPLHLFVGCKPAPWSACVPSRALRADAADGTLPLYALVCGRSRRGFQPVCPPRSPRCAASADAEGDLCALRCAQTCGAGRGRAQPTCFSAPSLVALAEARDDLCVPAPWRAVQADAGSSLFAPLPRCAASTDADYDLCAPSCAQTCGRAEAVASLLPSPTFACGAGRRPGRPVRSRRWVCCARRRGFQPL